MRQLYDGLSKSELQIFLFDDKSADNLGIVPDLNTQLIGKGKSGFNHFYFVSPKSDEEIDNAVDV